MLAPSFILPLIIRAFACYFDENLLNILVYHLNILQYRELIIQKARLERLSKTFLTLTWHHCLLYWRGVRDVVEDLPRSGRPSTSSTEINIAKVKEMVTENRHLSLREIAAELSMSHESIRNILKDCLDIERVAARLLPKDHLTKLSLWTNFWPKTQRISYRHFRKNHFFGLRGPRNVKIWWKFRNPFFT